MVFGSLPAILSQWFKKRRSLAFGVVAAGSSLGGIIIPITTSKLIDLVGYVVVSYQLSARLMDLARFKWTMRVVALIELFMLAIANLVNLFMAGSIRSHLSAFRSDSQAEDRSS